MIAVFMCIHCWLGGCLWSMGLLARFQGHILDLIVFQMENTGRQKNIVEEISLSQLSIPEGKTLTHLHKGGASRLSWQLCWLYWLKTRILSLRQFRVTWDQMLDGSCNAFPAAALLPSNNVNIWVRCMPFTVATPLRSLLKSLLCPHHN